MSDSTEVTEVTATTATTATIEQAELIERDAQTNDIAVLDRSTRFDTARGTINILIVDRDSDCADALEILLTDIPGVGSVATAASAALAIAEPDAIRAASYPDVIFIDPQARVDRVTSTQATLRALRRRMPAASIVLLNVYPGCVTRSLRGLVDYSIRKDTSHRELCALIDEIAGATPMVGACPVAG